MTHVTSRPETSNISTTGGKPGWGKVLQRHQRRPTGRPKRSGERSSGSPCLHQVPEADNLHVGGALWTRATGQAHLAHPNSGRTSPAHQWDPAQERSPPPSCPCSTGHAQEQEAQLPRCWSLLGLSSFSSAHHHQLITHWFYQLSIKKPFHHYCGNTHQLRTTT